MTRIATLMRRRALVIEKYPCRDLSRRQTIRSDSTRRYPKNSRLKNHRLPHRSDQIKNRRLKGNAMKIAKLTYLVSAVSILASLFVLHTPTPKSVTEAGSDGFSAANALKHIEVISRKPHSVFDQDPNGTYGDSHGEVRAYIIDQLETYISPTAVTEYIYSHAELEAEVGATIDDYDGDIHNVFAKIEGQSDTAIMLVAHYDSRGHVGRAGELGRSYGAADDGYGVATMLEIARIFGKNATLENSIYLLFTDAEEIGLYGAVMAATEPAIMDDVGFVINIEARGIKGASYMFETSAQNDKVIEFYRNAQYPVAYSLATAVYRVMPNYTDFSIFLGAGKQGINFAVLDSLDYYHTPADNYPNIDLSSIQHYGEQILPLVNEFVSDAKYAALDYFVGAQDYVFFTFMPNWMISYSELAGNVIAFIILAGLIGLIVYKTLKKQFSLKAYGIAVGGIFGSIAGFGIVGYLLARIIAWIGSVPFSLTYTKLTGVGPVVLVVLAAAAFLLFWLLGRKFAKRHLVEVVLAGVTFNLILALATGFTLSGASFLFMVPALTGLVAIIVATFVKWKPAVFGVYTLTQFVNIVLLLPILYSLYIALTIGALPVFLVILTIAGSVFIPVIRLQESVI